MCSETIYQNYADYAVKLDKRLLNDASEYYNFVSLMLAKEYGIPAINIQPLTGLCRWSNCTTKGNHRARYVNRMKAQLVLNALCRDR